MNVSVFLIVAALTGQSSWGGSAPCDTSFMSQFAQPAGRPVDIQPYLPMVESPRIELAQAPAKKLTKRAIRHRGVQFTVEGVLNQDGSITWDESSAFNRRAYEAALEAAVATRPVAQPKPVPPVAKKAASDNGAVVVDLDRDEIKEPWPDEKSKAAAKPKSTDPLNYGLEPDKIGRASNSYTANGDKAKQFVREARGEAEPGQKYHLTVIGSDDMRAQVLNDVATSPALASMKADLLVQDYKPGEWAVDPSLGFQEGILVQTAKSNDDPTGGKVIYRAKNYAEGAPGIAEALRKANPNYKPDKDPTPGGSDSTTGEKCPLGFTHKDWPTVIGVGIVLLVIFKLPRKEG